MVYSVLPVRTLSTETVLTTLVRQRQLKGRATSPIAVIQTLLSCYPSTRKCECGVVGETRGIDAHRGFQRDNASPSSVVTIRQRNGFLQLRPGPPTIDLITMPVPYGIRGFIIARSCVIRLDTSSTSCRCPLSFKDTCRTQLWLILEWRRGTSSAVALLLPCLLPGNAWRFT